MKRLLLLTFFTYTTAHAQVSLSLAQAMDLGVQNRFDVKAGRYRLAEDSQRVVQAKQAWLPDIKGAGGVQYNTQFQASYIPGGFVSSEPTLVALASKNATVFGLDLNQAIYNPTNGSDVALARNDLALQREKNRGYVIEIRERVSSAYLDVLLRALQRDIAVGDEARYQNYFGLAEGKYNQGALIETDYQRARLDYENARLQTLNATQAYEVALAELKYQVNLPQGTEVRLTDSLTGAFGAVNALALTPGVANAVAPGAAASDLVSDRTEIRQLELTQNADRLTLQKARRSVLPTVSFTANYSQEFLYDNFDYTKGQWWSPFSYIGLRLDLPLTAYYKNRSVVRADAFRVQQTDLELQQRTADIGDEIRTAEANVDNAQNVLEASRRNYDFSKEIYRNQEKRFRLGAFDYENLLDTDKSISAAEQAYVRAAYDYLVAELKYERATGRL